MNQNKIFEEMSEEIKELMGLIHAYVPADQRVRFMFLLNKIIEDAQELGEGND